MGLFEAKYCDICGEKIKFLGNKKLEDGRMCKQCESKLSPFFTGRRHTTLEDIKEQLKYREENESEVEAFNTTRTLGKTKKIMIDEPSEKFIVSSSKNYKDENPDFKIIIQVNSPYFDEITVPLDSHVDVDENAVKSGVFNPEYKENTEFGNEIKEALLNERQKAVEGAEPEEPKKAMQCPLCGATTIPDKNGCCEFCGGAIE